MLRIQTKTRFENVDINPQHVATRNLSPPTI